MRNGVRFRDRAEAGRLLGERVAADLGRRDAIVLGLPRGGVPVARGVARALGAPLDVFLVRKLGYPGQPELAMGAIASGGVRVLNDQLVDELGLDDELIDRVSEREEQELVRREHAYRGTGSAPELAGKTVVLVDDGLATGATMRAAVEAVRRAGPEQVVVAVPTAPPHALRELRDAVDGFVSLLAPEPFHAVGLWYEDFREVPDEEVRRLLQLPSEQEVRAGEADAALVVPDGARGLVVFAHGSGSSRFSPRNRYVAGVLEEAGLATLLVDLLTREEEQVDLRTRELRFDIDLLTERVVGALHWATSLELPIGLFGASTGAAAALVAAAREPGTVGAVVSRGGRPDLAGAALAAVRAPTLLIVGGRDELVLELNRRAHEAMTQSPVVELEIVPGATHLFEERGALERVAELARDWFLRHSAG
jgi:predicted phosphoribosyltransferase/dienelactone hydrolase